MSDYKLVAPCLLGAEGLVAEELRNMGLENVNAQNGRVVFDGSKQAMIKANIGSRYAERILIQLGEFNALTFEDLFQGTKALPWEEFISKKFAFPVKGNCLSSQLASVPDCQAIIKKAIVERLKQSYRVDWFEETGALTQVQFLIMKDKVSLMIDTSGAGLHKRGYRKHSTSAPIKETLAAMMVKLARVREDGTFFDPFCGSGTLLVEAATYAHNIAPGLRRQFIAETWGEELIWKDERERFKSLIKKDIAFEAFGSDIDEKAIELATENSRKAGVLRKIHIEKRDIKDFSNVGQYGCVVTNPPYGERLLDIKSAREVYKTMGRVFEPKRGWSYTIISPEEDFEGVFGRKADRRRKLYNGMIKCQVYMYYK
ncbi:MAG: class I SAM-dependent RNA methyltransferase [Clostridia bacterium]